MPVKVMEPTEMPRATGDPFTFRCRGCHTQLLRLHLLSGWLEIICPVCNTHNRLDSATMPSQHRGLGRRP